MYQALNEIGHDKYVEQLKDFMRNYNEEQVIKVPQSKKRTLDDVQATSHGAVEMIDASGAVKHTVDEEFDEDEILDSIDASMLGLDEEDAGQHKSKRLRKEGAGSQDSEVIVDIKTSEMGKQ